METMEERLGEVAARFRVALIALSRECPPLGFDDFPRGWCGHASALFCTYLNDNGVSGLTFEQVSGRKQNPFRSHAWVEGGGLIIDITADQFGQEYRPVWITRDRTWNSAWEEEDRSQDDVRAFPEVLHYLPRAYDFLSQWMSHSAHDESETV